MYLGEIVRTVLLSLIDAVPKPLLLNGKTTPALNTHWGLDTSVMSDVEMAYQGESSIAETPDFHGFDAAKLDKNTRDKLEKVRLVIVHKLGFADADVSLRDAAVCLP